MSKRDDNEMPFDDDGRIDLERWKRINAFVNMLHDMHYTNQQEKAKQFRTIRNNYLQELDMVDTVVDMMEEYPEAELIINKILRRLDNDKKY